MVFPWIGPMVTVGVDIGGTSVRAGVVDKYGTVLDTARAPTPGDERALEDTIVTVVSGLAARHRVRAVGLAVAGFVANDRRSVMFAPHLAWRHAPVADRIAERAGVPVVLEHDANAAALAEYRFGAARGCRVAVLVAIGTGIGAGLLLDGKVFRGANGVAPELGHLRLVPGGRPCSCGKAGCWERYCSGTALAATAVELLGRHRGSRPCSRGRRGTRPGRSPAGGSRALRGTGTWWRSGRWGSWRAGWARDCRWSPTSTTRRSS